MASGGRSRFLETTLVLMLLCWQHASGWLMWRVFRWGVNILSCKIFPIWGICFWYKYSPSVTRRTRQCSSQVIIMNNGGHCQRRYGAVMPSIWGPRLQVNRFLSQQHKVASIYVYTLHLFYVLRYVQKFIFIKIARMCMNCPFCHVPPVSFETFFRSLFSV